MTFAHIAFAAFLLLGHVALWIYVLNRLHSLALPRRVLKVFDVVWSSFGVLLPCAAGIGLLWGTVSQTPILPNGSWATALMIYCGFCIFAGVSAIVHRIQYVLQQRTTGLLTSNHTSVIDMVDQLGHRPGVKALTQMLSRVPGNEIYELSLHQKNLVVPVMDPALDGLTITHLSDLHLTGQMSQSFYEEVVRQANEFEADLIVLTGDIIESRECLPWIAPTLGKLRAPYGVYYVVGNHELRLGNIGLIRQTLDDAGLIALGGRWQRVNMHGHPVVLAGNELPWFQPAADLSTCPITFDGKSPLRILLSHSPDQLDWARRQKFDLMLAGHTHGGQVRFPLIGPLLAPSWQGIKHASGTFYAFPTLMHVSRGISGTRPIRWNCRPELAKLRLSSGLKEQPEQSTIS